MAHSGKEAVAMRCTKCVFLLLLLGLSVLLAGCEFRDILDDYPVSGVQIKLDWKAVARRNEGDLLPEKRRRKKGGELSLD